MTTKNGTFREAIKLQVKQAVCEIKSLLNVLEGIESRLDQELPTRNAIVMLSIELDKVTNTLGLSTITSWMNDAFEQDIQDFILKVQEGAKR